MVRCEFRSPGLLVRFTIKARKLAVSACIPAMADEASLGARRDDFAAQWLQYSAALAHVARGGAAYRMDESKRSPSHLLSTSLTAAECDLRLAWLRSELRRLPAPQPEEDEAPEGRAAGRSPLTFQGRVYPKVGYRIRSQNSQGPIDAVVSIKRHLYLCAVCGR